MDVTNIGQVELTKNTEKPHKRLGRPLGRNKSNEARRRHQLIEATIDSIVLNGLAGTTLATVAELAGLSQGVVVFYFKNKQQLFIETLRAHYEEYQGAWLSALDQAGDDPVDRIVTLVSASLTDAMSTPRQLGLWFAFWGEVKARPKYAEIADVFEKQRRARLCELCKDAGLLLAHTGWSADTLAETTDAMADGLLLKMHISPDGFDAPQARAMLGAFLALVFPAHRDRVFAVLDAL